MKRMEACVNPPYLPMEELPRAFFFFLFLGRGPRKGGGGVANDRSVKIKIPYLNIKHPKFQRSYKKQLTAT